MTEIVTEDHPLGIVKFQDYNGDWRIKMIQQRSKLTNEKKGIFLEELAKHGRIGHAAQAAGVTSRTVSCARFRDEVFDEACINALELYKDRLIEHHQDLVFNGTKRISYDRLGNVIAEETIFPIRLIELELKKHDEGYRDKREVSMNISGGVLVAPAEVKSIDDWESRFSREDEIIDAVTVENDQKEDQVQDEEQDGSIT